jgi:hypothetical protein
MSAFQHWVEGVSIAALLCLIDLLSTSEILSASKLWNKHLSLPLTLAILQLVVTIFAITAFWVFDIFSVFLAG